MRKPTKFGAWPRKRFRNRLRGVMSRSGDELRAIADEMRRAGATEREVAHVVLDATLDATAALGAR